MTIQEFVRRGRAGEDLRVHTLDHDWRLQVVRPSAFMDNGVKPVHRLTTRSGRSIRVTSNHPFRTVDGWAPLHDLTIGSRIAVPRQLKCASSEEIPDALVALTAYLIGDGNLTAATPRLTAYCPQIRADVRAWVAQLGMRAADTARRPCWKQDCPDSEVAHGPAERDHKHPTGLNLRAAAGQANHLTRHLRASGLMGLRSVDKHVPDAYFRLPPSQIKLFLSRLYATDGWAYVQHIRRRSHYETTSPAAQIGYCTISERLARDVQHLLLRIGIAARVERKKVTYQGETRGAWQVMIRDTEQAMRFCLQIGIFSKDEQIQKVVAAVTSRDGIAKLDTIPRAVWPQVLAAKSARSWREVSVAAGRPVTHNWHVGKRDVGRRLLGTLATALASEELQQLADSDVLWDEIVSIEPDGEAQVYDLTIDGTHNFVANDIIVHNSTLGLDVARHAAVKASTPTVIFSLEMSRTELVQRLMCAECSVDMQRLRTGRLEEGDWARLTRSLGKLADAPLFIDDSANTTLMEIRAKCRRLKQRNGLGLVIVDYLQLMQPAKRSENRQQEVSEMSRGLKLLAKELELPVIAISQLSRQPEARSDKKPMLSDLRESGSLEQDADMVILLYRDDAYDSDSPRKGEADFIVAKHRNGPTDTVTVTFQGQYSRFTPMAARSM